MFLSSFNDAEKRAFLELAHRAAWVDGAAPAQEVALLAQFRAETGLSEVDYPLQHLPLAAAASTFKQDYEKRAVMVELVAMILADGFEHPAESKFIVEVQHALGLKDEERDHAFDWSKRLMALYAEGVEFLKGQRALAGA